MKTVLLALLGAVSAIATPILTYTYPLPSLPPGFAWGTAFDNPLSGEDLGFIPVPVLYGNDNAPAVAAESPPYVQPPYIPPSQPNPPPPASPMPDPPDTPEPSTLSLVALGFAAILSFAPATWSDIIRSCSKGKR